MMTVMEFFALSAGEWMCQRTSHHLAFRRSEGEIADANCYPFARRSGSYPGL